MCTSHITLANGKIQIAKCVKYFSIVSIRLSPRMNVDIEESKYWWIIYVTVIKNVFPTTKISFYNIHSVYLTVNADDRRQNVHFTYLQSYFHFVCTFGFGWFWIKRVSNNSFVNVDSILDKIPPFTIILLKRCCYKYIFGCLLHMMTINNKISI